VTLPPESWALLRRASFLATVLLT